MRLNGKKLRDILVIWKFRFDIAASFLVFFNFFLLVITASEKIQSWLNQMFNVDFNIYSVIGYIIIFAFFCVFFAGFILDKYIRYQQGMLSVQNMRNIQLMEILNNTRELKAEIEKLQNDTTV